MTFRIRTVLIFLTLSYFTYCLKMVVFEGGALLYSYYWSTLREVSLTIPGVQFVSLGLVVKCSSEVKQFKLEDKH